jgi:membrane-bound serine protease (ClpP class)
VTLHTANVATYDNSPGFFTDLLYVLANPNLAFLLLSLGGLALVSEMFHPTFFAGVFGVIALIMAYFALGSLETNWAGAALVLFGIALLTAEVFVSGFGVLGIGGMIALALGGILLTGGNDPDMRVSRWLVFAMTAVAGAFLLGLVGALVRMRRQPVHVGSMVGARGIARSRLDPDGVVWVAGERWEAVSEDGSIELDDSIIVSAIDGLKLTVRRDPASIKLLPPAGAANA